MAGWIDLHCHVLPGVDDGPLDVSAAVPLVRQLEALGFTDLYPTPHQKAGSWVPAPEETDRAAHELRAALAAEGGGAITVHPPAGENMWDELFLARREGGFPTYPGGRAFLVEFPVTGTPPGVGEALFQLRLAGRLPVVAHVERYPDVARDARRLEAIARSAALLVNLGSLGGEAGWGLRRLARRLVKDGRVQGVATDAHSVEDVAACQAGLRWLITKLGEDDARRLLTDGPRRIIAGELPEW